LELTMRTAMLGLDPPPCRWLTFVILNICQGQLGRQWLYWYFSTSPLCITQACVWQWAFALLLGSPFIGLLPK
jgi:hypothetical protein